MALSIRVATTLILVLHVQLVSTSPAQFGSARQPRRHAKWMWARQRRQDLPIQSLPASWPTNHSPESDTLSPNDSPFQLPPVDAVFKMVANTESRQRVQQQDHVSPTVAPQILALSTQPSLPKVTSSPTSTPRTAIAPTTTIMQPNSQTSYHGPGLAIPSSTVYPEADLSEEPISASNTGISPANPTNVHSYVPVPGYSTMSGAVPFAHPTENGPILDAAQPVPSAGPSHKASMPGRKLVIVGALMAGLICLMLLIYVILDRRLFALCWRKKQKEEDSWKKLNSPPPPDGSEKEIEYQNRTAPSQRSASSVYSHGTTCQTSASEPNTPGAYNARAGDVMDINSNYPRSKFSLCSSEYPTSVSSESYARSDDSTNALQRDEDHASAEILPEYQFYCQPPELLDDRQHHSRAYSLPIVAPQGAPKLLVRTIEHRKSRSVSGLTYTVKPQEHRESGSSAGGWGGESPQSPAGWPSAI